MHRWRSAVSGVCPAAISSRGIFWLAEVTKMIKIYGALIDQSDVGKIVDYLAASQ